MKSSFNQLDTKPKKKNQKDIKRIYIKVRVNLSNLKDGCRKQTSPLIKMLTYTSYKETFERLMSKHISYIEKKLKKTRYRRYEYMARYFTS